MPEVEDWSNGKPYLIALAAPWLVNQTQYLHMAFEQLKEWRFMNHKLPATDLPTWHALYRSHMSSVNVLKIIFAAVYGERITEIGYFVYRFLITSAGFKKKLPTSRPSQRVINFVANFLGRVLVSSFKLLRKNFSGAPFDPAVKEALCHQVTTNIEFAFFVQVTAPCWILYGIPPAHLYRQACRGNVDALENLLRLDSLMVHEPYISKRIASLRFGNTSVDYERLLKAPHRSPNVIITREHMKISIAGLISVLASNIGHPLNAPEIRRLFNAVAKDSAPDSIKGETLEDSDFDELGEWGFSKAIQRSRKRWLKMLIPDKKSFSGVRVTKLTK